MNRTYYYFDKREKKEHEVMLGICENDKCKRSFITEDGTKGAPQKYCGKLCSGIVRTRKWYIKKKKKNKKNKNKIAIG
jgi:superfamily II DNA helicase RecQ